MHKLQMNPILNKTFYVAALLVIAGILLYVSQYHLAIPVYVAGSILFAITRVTIALTHKNKRTSRIPYIQLLSASALLFSAYLMHKGANSWAVFALITAALEAYATFRMNQ